MTMSKKWGLGRGLDALLSADPLEAPISDPGQGGEEINSEPEGNRILMLSLDCLRPGIHQPRSAFGDNEMEELAESVRLHGVLQPILVNRTGENYEIIAGERRWRAAQLLGLAEIPAIAVNVAEKNSLEIAVIENIQRSDLNPMEEAAAYQSMMERLFITQEEVASRVGKERSTVANYLRLLRLPAPVRESVAAGVLSMGHARALLALRSEKEIIKLARVAEKLALSVRQLENRIRKILAGPMAKKGRYALTTTEGQLTGPHAVFLQKIGEQLRDALGTKISMRGDENTGEIVIEYYSAEMLESIVDRFS